MREYIKLQISWIILFALSSGCMGMPYYIYLYGTPQSKQSKTPERWRNFFLRHPLKIAQKCLSLQFFLHIPINHDVKASEKI